MRLGRNTREILRNKVHWDLMWDPDNPASLCVTCAWQEAQLWDPASDPILQVQGEPNSRFPLHWQVVSLAPSQGCAPCISVAGCPSQLIRTFSQGSHTVCSWGLEL